MRSSVLYDLSYSSLGSRAAEGGSFRMPRDPGAAGIAAALDAASSRRVMPGMAGVA